MYLASQQLMAASASPMFSSANRRAFCSRLRWRCNETCSAISSQCPGGVALWPGTSAQKCANSVSSAVRAVLVLPPYSSVRLKSAAYRVLSKAGGGGGRNCEALVMAQGVTCPHCGVRAEVTPGVSSYSPGGPCGGAGV